jgi:hypothetical protein
MALEQRARDGLYVTVALAIERMRACADCREGKTMGKVIRRGDICERLQHVLPAEFSAMNLFREGQTLAARWHPGKTSHQVLKSTYQSVATLPGAKSGRVNPAAIEQEQIDLVRTAGVIYEKTLAFQGAQHEASAALREMMGTSEFKNAIPTQQNEIQARFLCELAPASMQELAHNKLGGCPILPQLMCAACSMDFNPAWVFTNVASYKTEFDCAMLLGGAERGIGVMLTAAHIRRLKRFIALADAADPIRVVVGDDEAEAARCLRDLALHVKSREVWEKFFAIAEADGGSLWVTKALE